MEKSCFRRVFDPSLEKPIFVQGLPGLGNIGKIAAHLLIKFCGAKPFAELYSPSFPDYSTANSRGICHLPHYEFYAAALEKADLIIMTGDTQPPVDDVATHYALCSEILDFVEKHSPSFVVTIGGVLGAEKQKQVMVAATSSRLASEYVEKGATIYSKGTITGAAGLLLGLAKERDIDGVCLLGTTTSLSADRGAGFSVFKFLINTLGMERKEGL